MKRGFRLSAAALCLAAAVYFLLPLSIGVCHIGMFYPSALLVLLCIVLLFPQQARRLFTGRWRKWCITAAAILGAAVVCVLAVMVVIAAEAADTPAEGEEVTVIVLGCQVVDSEPSVMLRQRINAAYAYLAAHPEAKCIATGGKGENEDISEAACIRRELVELGIDESRIFVEDRSVNTAENMAFSAEIIRQEGLPTTLAVASDNFHQLRAGIFAARNGLQTRSLGCKSLWFLGPGYWAREVLALGAAFIRGY